MQGDLCHTRGSMPSRLAGWGPPQPHKPESRVPCWTKRSNRLHLFSVAAVRCAQPPAKGFSRCVLQEGRESLDRVTARVPGGLGGETGGRRGLRVIQRDKAGVCVGTRWVVLWVHGGLVAVGGQYPREEGGERLRDSPAGGARKGTCRAAAAPAPGQRLPARRGHHRAAWADGAVARRR